VELERRERDVESDVGILCGDIDDRLKLVVLRDEQFIVAFFLSSAFTDTEWERNLLISDVLPYLAELARKYGLELRLAEMRWGIRKEASSENQTSQNELERCQRESLGLFYVFLACQKYGFRPFPPRTPEGTSAKGTNARSAGARASASISASGADARSAGARALLTPAHQEQTRGCQPAWRSSREQCMVPVQTRDLSHDLSHDPYETHFCRETSSLPTTLRVPVPGCACVCLDCQ